MSNQISACCFNIKPGRKKALWEVVHTCPLDCRYCWLGDKTKILPLPLEANKKIVDKLKNLGVKDIIFSGGDPLMYPDFFNLAEYAESLGFRLTLWTVGQSSEEKLKAICERKFDSVNLSIDSLDSSQNDFFRGQPGALERLLFTADYCRQHGKKVVIKIIVTRLNYRQLGEMIKFILQKGFKVSLGRFLPIGQAIHSSAFYLLNKDEKKEAMKELNNWREVAEVEINGFNLSGGGFLKACPAGQEVISILPDGRLSPCPLMKNLDPRLAKEWGENLPDWKEELNSGPWLMKSQGEKTCHACPVHDYCSRGCLAAAVAFNQGYDLLCGRELVEKRKVDFVASALVLNPAGDKIIFIQRVKEPLIGYWLPPGGHLTEGESPDNAVIREVREETGLDTFFNSQLDGEIQADERTQRIASPLIIQREFIDYRHDHIDLIFLLRAFAEGPLKVQGDQIAMWMGKEAIEKMPMPENVRQAALSLLRKSNRENETSEKNGTVSPVDDLEQKTIVDKRA